MPRKPSLSRTVLDNFADTRALIDDLRALDRAVAAFDTPEPGATFDERLWFHFKKLMRVVRRELAYAVWIPLTVLLIVAFNLAAVTLLIWVLSIL